MKVVLFCGGLGTRLREYTSTIPKPMVHIGEQPILWHLMKYYAHYGHTDFILCLGYKGDMIKQYFAPSKQTNSSHVERVENWQQTGWNIQFADTGINANIGQRLLAVEPYINENEVFLANYSDGLSDLPLNHYLQHVHEQNKIASFVSVKPNNSFHAVNFDESGLVNDICPAHASDFWINGGFFIFKHAIFNHIHDGEELVEQPFKRLIAQQQLLAYPYQGFWACMDTLKDKKTFDERVQKEDKLWRVWQSD